MEIRALKYFLAIAREENMTKAAETLHISQPALTKQIHNLEAELGKKLFSRHSFSLELTAEGKLLQKRAEDLLTLATKITDEFAALDNSLGGDIYLGSGESYQLRHLAKIIHQFKTKHPHFHYHLISGDTEQVTEKLNKGLLDFAIIFEEPDLKHYNALSFPQADTWGVLMSTTAPLAKKSEITWEDLKELPLFCSEQSWKEDIPRWCGTKIKELNLEGTYRLVYNASVFAKEGLGYVLAFNHIVDISPGSGLVFRPLSPKLETKMYIIWKKDQVFTPIAERFKELLENTLPSVHKKA